jgi:penicillin-binding protein 1A
MNQKYFSYDHVGQGKRQPGSTFKAILYATAVMNGYTPCSEILDGPVSVPMPDGKIWRPKAKPTGRYIHLKVAMARSLNNIAALLIKDIGPQNVVDQAKRFGIDTKNMQAVHSLALGTSPVNLLELTAAYTVFANKGNYIKPNYLLKIEDKYGRVIYTKESSLKKRVMSEYEAFEMTQMLREGSSYNEYINGKYYGGTSRRLITEYHLDKNYNQIGGKTGTTQNSADGWYMGITPVIVTGTWVGGVDNRVHFQNTYRGRKWGQGARMAMPIFAKTLQKAYKEKILSTAQFSIPNNISPEQFDTEIRCMTEDME